MFEKLEHTALSVEDIERSLKFYCELLGFTVLKRLEPDPALPQGKVLDLQEDAGAKIAHLELGGVMLELFQFVKPLGKPLPKEFTQADHGFTHIALKTQDTKAAYQYLVDRDVEFYSEPVEFRPGVWICFFRGPDGETIELRQT